MITLKSDGTIVDNQTVTIVKETYLDVKVEEYTLGTTEDTYKISMDITPKCNLIATTLLGYFGFLFASLHGLKGIP